MRLVVSVEEHFHRTPDGVVWTQAQFAYPFWARYLAVFDRVRVVARVRETDRVPAEFVPASGRAVSFARIPEYLGPGAYLRQLPRIRRAIRAALRPDDAAILRVPSPIGTHLHNALRRAGRPYGVEVVSDPYFVFAPGALKHPLRPYFRWLFTRQLRDQCANATAAAYVTRAALQRRYPNGAAAGHRREYGIADAVLGPESFVSQPRPPRPAGERLTLVTIGSFANLNKAPDILLDALASCRRAGLDLQLAFVGDGRHRREMATRADELGLAGRVAFLGRLTLGDAVRRQLDSADLFVLPSRQEGLPRAVIEAMARGLPCVATSVGGIPELLDDDDLVPPGDAGALAARIAEVARDPARRAAMAARNLARAREYGDEVLQPRRIAFYREVEASTRSWLGGRASRDAKER